MTDKRHDTFSLPRSLDDIDAPFMTRVLRQSGALSASNEVVCQEASGIGPAIGYFSTIKRFKCIFKEPTSAARSYVAKTWPVFEALPHDKIKMMFELEINSYRELTSQFYPRPRIHLAAFDVSRARWLLIMDDIDSFAVHKSHESEMTFDEVNRMIPRLVDIAVAWEGCDQGKKAAQLSAVGIEPWVSQSNLGVYKTLMPPGAKLMDKFTSIGGNSVAGVPTWPERVGGPGIIEMLVRRSDAFFAHTLPANGATCTLSHGDLKGDNIFFCNASPDYPHGWLCIDFQMMFRGPIPSDLAYLMSSGSVLPDVYVGDNLHRILHTFHEQFMRKTQLYRSYTYDQFRREYAIMSAVPVIYYVGIGAAFWIAGAYHNQTATRVELGNAGATEADLTAQERRQRMWWRKILTNSRENFRTFGQYAQLQGMADNLEKISSWVELPDHLR